jgi:hypothetical protein
MFRVIVFMNSCCNMLLIQLVETERDKILFILAGPKIFWNLLREHEKYITVIHKDMLWRKPTLRPSQEHYIYFYTVN